MTDSCVTSSIVLANTLAIVTMATTELNPFLKYAQNGASVGAIMGIFLWREMKRAERYEKPLIPLPAAAIFYPFPPCLGVALV